MKYKNIEQVWEALDNGITVNWVHDGYKVYIEDIYPDNEFQKAHFTRRGNKVLSIRCIENYFGGLICESELGKLFSEEK
jgi:hypothetical protein